MATAKATEKATKTSKAKSKPAATRATKKSPAKKPVARKASAASSRGTSTGTKEFMTPRFTIQTIYWLIIAALFLAFGLWILTLQMQIHRMYDRIELNQSMINVLTPAEQDAAKEAANTPTEATDTPAAQ